MFLGNAPCSQDSTVIKGGTGAVSKWLNALAEDPGSVLSTFMLTHKHP